MRGVNHFFEALGIGGAQGRTVKDVCRLTGIPLNRIRYYADFNLIPTGSELKAIRDNLGITEEYLRIRMGRIDRSLLRKLQAHANNIAEVVADIHEIQPQSKDAPELAFRSALGSLYKADCLDFLPTLKSDTVDVVFADPPFNLKKLYPSKIDDDLKVDQYLDWSHEWLLECVRVLRPGGSLFLWNLPRWNSELADLLNQHLLFRHWIAVDIKYRLPIAGRLYPSHYSLLYYVKGQKPRAFHPDRLPMPTCPKCNGDLRDYGGYKKKMNPTGVNISDVWTDIPPVRHAKYKRRNGANELSLKLLDRVIELSSDEGDLILDPFGGSGTTYMAAELKERRWIGCEIGPCDDIVNRFGMVETEREILSNYRSRLNALFPPDILKKREKAGLWTPRSIGSAKDKAQRDLFRETS